MWIENGGPVDMWPGGIEREWVRGFWGSGVLARIGILVSGFWILNSGLSFADWHGVYDDAPISVHIKPSKRLYHVGDTFRLSITATNTSDRDLLIKRDWNEQLVFYHIHPGTGEQIEWPGQLLLATWVDSSDVVRLAPNESYTIKRDIRVWTTDDVATFPFRLKLGGIKDYGHKFAMWRGIAWSNAITLTVRPNPQRR